MDVIPSPDTLVIRGNENDGIAVVDVIDILPVIVDKDGNDRLLIDGLLLGLKLPMIRVRDGNDRLVRDCIVAMKKLPLQVIRPSAVMLRRAHIVVGANPAQYTKLLGKVSSVSDCIVVGATLPWIRVRLGIERDRRDAIVPGVKLPTSNDSAGNDSDCIEARVLVLNEPHVVRPSAVSVVKNGILLGV